MGDLKVLTSQTEIPRSTQASKSMWSEPTPAVTHSLRFLAYVDGIIRYKNLRGEAAEMRTYSCDEILGEITRVERSGDQNVGLHKKASVIQAIFRSTKTYIFDMLLEITCRPFFRAGHLISI